MRCRHQWEEVARRFVPPVSRAFKARSMSNDELRELIQGVTVVELRCTKCGDIAERRLLGRAAL